MPPRWLCIFIVASWLAVTSWLLWHDLLPHLLPGGPPPYSVELVEEAQTTRTDTNWSIHKDGVPIARAMTRVAYLQPGKPRNPLDNSKEDYPLEPKAVPRNRPVFELALEVSLLDLRKPFAANGFLINKLKSSYFVDQAGNLKGIWAAVNGKLDVHELSQLVGSLNLNIEDEMEEGRMTPRLSVELLPAVELLPEKPSPLPPKHLLSKDLAPVQSDEMVIMPLHPINRHRGLQPGQTWRARLLDPLAVAQSILVLHGLTDDLPLLHARVRTQEELWEDANKHSVPCLVIDYEGDDVKLTVWVARKNGLVMRQEALLDRVHWVTERTK
jgi:hypothetical protein